MPVTDKVSNAKIGDSGQKNNNNHKNVIKQSNLLQNNNSADIKT